MQRTILHSVFLFLYVHKISGAFPSEFRGDGINVRKMRTFFVILPGIE